MPNVHKTVDITKGLNNCMSPTSPLYPEGSAYVSDNSRLDKDGFWNKAPVITSNSTGTLRVIPNKTGLHFRPITILGTQYITGGLSDTDTIVSGSNGYGYYLVSGVPYWWSGVTSVSAVQYTDYDVSGLSRPTTDPVMQTMSAKGTRMEEGIYYYFYTFFDPTRLVESLPSDVIENYVRRYYVNDVRQVDVPIIRGVVPDMGEGNEARETRTTVRYYRSKVIKIRKGDSVQLANQNNPLEFYFIGESSAGKGNHDWSDYASDEEIAKPENLYTGRGSAPPTSDVIASYQNRTFYFKDGDCYWSSSGRPEEVPQEYTLTVNQTYSVGTWTGEVLTAGASTELAMSGFRPILETGIESAAKMKLPITETVKGAIEFQGKLWVFTEHSAGCITPTAKCDGFDYNKAADGIGICSPQTLQNTPFGLFGADKKGVWQITDSIRRISYGIVDIDTSSKSSYLNYSSYAAASFGVWVDTLNEYWWSFQSSATPTYAQIVYQADIKSFAGVYKLTLTGGCSFVNSGGFHCYLTGGKTPTISADRNGGGVQTLKFWLGQESLAYVKDNLLVVVLYDSITADQNITALVYQNSIASETGAQTNGTHTHNDDNLVGLVDCNGSGRVFELSLSIPTTCTAPIASICYSFSLEPDGENANR